jgi:hypothetical protein
MRKKKDKEEGKPKIGRKEWLTKIEMALGLRDWDAYTSERRDEAESALLSEEICSRTTIVAEVQPRIRLYSAKPRVLIPGRSSGDGDMGPAGVAVRCVCLP